MSRTYTLKRRAEQQAQTRQRIVDAAVDLHSRIGPAATTISMIADQAGVQRHTLYAHFPDERSLYLACSGYTTDLDPLPNAETWRAIVQGRERLRTGLTAIYGWYARNASLVACVLRDAEYHALTREISEMRWGPSMAAYPDVLGEKLNARQRALLHVALSFYTWRTLVREGGMDLGDAVAAMVQSVDCAK